MTKVAMADPKTPADLFCPGIQVRMDWFDLRGVHRSSRTIIEDETPRGLLLQAPTERSVVVPIRSGTEVALLLTRTVAQAYVAMVRVTATRQGSPPVVEVTRPAVVEKTTQRRYFRVDVDVPAKVGRTDVRVVDLSGGGCLLLWPRALHDPTPAEGERVQFDLKLRSRDDGIPVTARVVRVLQGYEGGPSRIGLEFIGLTRRQEDDVVAFVFVRQQALLRGGLLRPSPTPGDDGAA